MDDLIWRVQDYPQEVVDAVVYSIPEHVILNERATFCDLGMGGGQFLRGILDRCIAAGQSKDQVLPRLYGVERSVFYLNYAKWKNNLEGTNLVRCINIEEWNPQMKFDAIVGNPPYQKGKNSSFYVQFLKRAEEVLKPGGFFSMLIPSKAALISSKAQKFFTPLGLNLIEFGLESYFPHQGQPIAQFKGIKGAESGQIVVKTEDQELVIPRESVLPVRGASPIAISILNKLFSNPKKLAWQKLKEPPQGHYTYTARVAWGYSEFKPKGGHYAMLTHIDHCDQYFDGRFMPCETTAQAEAYQWLLSRSRLYRFAVYCCCKATYIPPMFWNLTPDLVHCQTNEDLYKEVGLTAEEVSYIEDWNNNNR